jgi:pentapeptide repeat protein
MESEAVTFDIEKDQRIQDLRQAIDSTVFQLRTASFALVAATVYLFVAGLGTSDLDLLLGRIEKLPVVDLDVSLLWFYVLAPPILIVVHATVLNLCRSVAHRLRDLEVELNRRSITEPDREFVLGLLYPYPLVERLTQPPERTVIRLFLNFSIYFFAVIMPIMALMWLGLRFVAYQDVWISAWQAICVLLDLAIVWSLWSHVLWEKGPGRREGRPPFKQDEKAKIQRRLTDWLFVDAFVTTVAAALAVAPVCIGALWGFENLPWGTGTLDVRSDREAGGESAETSPRPATMTKDELNSRLTALLYFKDQRSVDFASVIETGYSKIGADFHKRSLRSARLNMSLVGANLSQADLTSADLTGADLRNAILRYAILDNAKLDYAHVEGADLTGASVRGADLPYAQLQGAILYGADFTGADLTGAHLQLVRLKKRETSDSAPVQSWFPVFGRRRDPGSTPFPVFRGAVLRGAQMQGIPLDEE